MTRKPLPNRRPCVTTDTDWQGHPMTVTVGRYLDGTPGEVFASHPTDSNRNAEWADNCTGLSIAMQYGIPADVLGKSFGTVPVWALADGAMVQVDAPASPSGTIIAAIRDAIEELKE